MREEGPEIRLAAIADDVAARIIARPVWTRPMLDAHRSILGLTIELHTVAAAAHQLLTVRTAMTDIPTDDGSDVLARARAEWERRHVVAAQVKSALIDRVAALRAYEAALTPVETSLRNLRVVTELGSWGRGRGPVASADRRLGVRDRACCRDTAAAMLCPVTTCWRGQLSGRAGVEFRA
ncbi:hypothetical protein ACFRFQ_21530 [Rhodococcus sp. NPDC056743]|uniref:hypothetical protein n=1 Tax=Rhodococcus sp. NPDC056743 TaxID=3345934 RepID=UPI00366FA1FC